MALFPFFFANKFKISPRPDSNTVNSINSSIRGVDLTIVSTVRSYFFDRRIDHILSAIGTYSSDGWNTHGTDGWIITNGNKTRVCRHNSCRPPFLVVSCGRLVCVGFAKHGEDGNEQNPALLLCRVAQESLSAVTISFFTATAVMRAFHGYCIILIQPVLVRPEHTPADSSASKQQ